MKDDIAQVHARRRGVYTIAAIAFAADAAAIYCTGQGDPSKMVVTYLFALLPASAGCVFSFILLGMAVALRRQLWILELVFFVLLGLGSFVLLLALYSTYLQAR